MSPREQNCPLLRTPGLGIGCLGLNSILQKLFSNLESHFNLLKYIFLKMGEILSSLPRPQRIKTTLHTVGVVEEEVRSLYFRYVYHLNLTTAISLLMYFLIIFDLFKNVL